MFIFTYIAALFAVICFVFAGLIFYERGRDLKAQYVALLIFSAGVWSFANALADISFTQKLGVFWSGIALIAVILLASTLLSFTVHLLSPNKKFSTLRNLFYFLPVFVTTLFAFSHFSITDVFVLYTRPTEMELGIIYIPLTLYVYLSFIVSSWYLFKYSKSSTEITWLQVFYIVIGIASTLIGIAIFSLVFPVFFHELSFYSAAPLFTIPMILSISYAIFKHHFLDIRLTIQRGLIYSILLSLLLGLYLLFLFVSSLIFESLTEITVIISGAIATVFGILGAPHIIQYFRRVTDKFFFRDTYNYSYALHELAEVLNKSIDLKDITYRAGAELTSILKAKYVRVDLHDSFVEESFPLSLLIPIPLKGETIGTIILGPKKSGARYSDDDILLLRTFAHHIATTLERARLYEEVKMYSRTLEEKVKERTKEIQNLQEEQRRIMMDIAHGLQTPLTIVKNKINTVRKKSHNSKELMYAERSIDEVSELIYKLLKLIHLGYGSNVLKKEPVHLSQLLIDTCEYVKTIAYEQNIIVHCSIEPELYVLGDKKRLEELILNISSNAIKYMKPEGKKKISVVFKKENSNVHLLVTDTGIGISEKELIRIFERFYRASHPFFQKIKGTGLGLSIAKEIVEKHKGLIWAESKEGRGTTLHVVLPLLLQTE